MDAWLDARPRGIGIMPVHYYNKSFWRRNLIRYRGPEDFGRVERALIWAYNRKPKEEPPGEF